jgi:hypothetical protein
MCCRLVLMLAEKRGYFGNYGLAQGSTHKIIDLPQCAFCIAGIRVTHAQGGLFGAARDLNNDKKR